MVTNIWFLQCHILVVITAFPSTPTEHLGGGVLLKWKHLTLSAVDPEQFGRNKWTRFLVLVSSYTRYNAIWYPCCSKRGATVVSFLYKSDYISNYEIKTLRIFWCKALLIATIAYTILHKLCDPYASHTTLYRLEYYAKILTGCIESIFGI